MKRTRLRVISTPVKTIDDGLRTLIADMFETMYDAPGSGWPFNRS
jgi:peptide deformylase